MSLSANFEVRKVAYNKAHSIAKELKEPGLPGQTGLVFQLAEALMTAGIAKNRKPIQTMSASIGTTGKDAV